MDAFALLLDVAKRCAESLAGSNSALREDALAAIKLAEAPSGETLDEKIIFAFGAPEAQPDGVPVLILGIPAAAWAWMRDGKNCHFDMSRAGVPLKVVAFGGSDHNTVLNALNVVATSGGGAPLDLRHEDFGIKPYPARRGH